MERIIRDDHETAEKIKFEITCLNEFVDEILYRDGNRQYEDRYSDLRTLLDMIHATNTMAASTLRRQL